EGDDRLLTQEDVAEAIGTSSRTIRAWELGESFPSKYYSRKLCEFYGKTPQELGLDKEAVLPYESRESGSWSRGTQQTIVEEVEISPLAQLSSPKNKGEEIATYCSNCEFELRE